MVVGAVLVCGLLVAAVVSAAAQQSVVSIFAMLDAVPLHHKNGLTEVYGADLRPRPSGPIGVAASVLQVSDDRSILAWQPDHSPARAATHLLLSVDPTTAAGRVTIAITNRAGATYAFTATLGTAAPTASPKPLPPLVPEEFLGALAAVSTTVPLVETAAGGQWLAPLPAQLVAELNVPDTGEEVIRSMLVVLDGAAGREVVFRYVGLIQKSEAADRVAGIRACGVVSGGTVPPGAGIALLQEDGVRREQLLSQDGRFCFANLPAGMPVSLRFEHARRDHYSTLGRWFALDRDREDIRVALEPVYVNADGHAADPTKARFVTPRHGPSTVGAFYESHARQVWPGAVTPQEYDSVTFTNNFGFIDRDRFFDNPGKCYRVVHLGSSHAVALQVRPFEKFNIEMESELAVRMQRCVEVIHAGRDNGDVGSNYPRVLDYAVRFKPDVILLENCAALTMQLQPELLQRGFGWNHEMNALDNFYFDATGEIQLRSWSPDYPAFATKPDYAELTPGVPLFKTLQVPMAQMHPLGRDAFRYLGAVLGYFRRHHPDQRFVLHTGLDEAQCRDACNTEVALPGGVKVPIGARTFVENQRQFCNEQGLDCLTPRYPEGYADAKTYLTFVNDGHYSVRGHQWLARELATALLDLRPQPAPRR